MPRYSYRCLQCEKISELTHKYKEIIVSCPLCEASGSLEKLLNTPIQRGYINPPRRQPLSVKEYIAETKEELKKDKKDLQRRKR